MPSVRGVGAVGTGTVSCTVAVPTGGEAPQSGDAMLILTEYVGATTSDTTVATASGWTPLVDSFAQSGGAQVTHLTVLGKIAGASETDVTVTNVTAGNHIIGRMIVVYDHGLAQIEDAVDGTVLNGMGDTSPETHDISGITVTAGSLVLLIGTNNSDTTSTAMFDSWANANLTSITEQIDNTTNVGNGGGIGLATGACAGTTTGTSTVSFTFAGSLRGWQSVHIGVPSASGNANVTPSTVTGSSSVPTVQVEQSPVAIVPTAVAATGVVIDGWTGLVTAETLAGGAVDVTPTTVTGSGTVPAVSVAAQGNAAPTGGAVAGSGTVLGPSVAAVRIAAATPTTVTGTGTVPAASVAAGGSTGVSPAAVQATGTVPAPSVVVGINPIPATVTAAASIPTATVAVTRVATVTPAAVVASRTVPTATVVTLPESVGRPVFEPRAVLTATEGTAATAGDEGTAVFVEV